ncbi:MAG: threonine/serine dehydratase [Anaerolineae bacterium]|nr:threonine/serine dehydratase [Anaerolineae bacterium]
MITIQDVRDAQQRIDPYVRRTPTVGNHTLCRELRTNMYLKLELFQKTGSFKPRGAFNKMLRHRDEAQERGVVAVSGGNFAQAVAYAGTTLGVRTRILMPAYTPAHYVEATQSYGAEVEIAPDVQACFEAARAYERQGRAFYHPYDDPEAMAGYGTVGLELLDAVPELSDVVVSVGGGGLMSGIAVAVKGLKPDVRVWTVETKGCDALAMALEAGHVVQITPTSLAKTLGAPSVAEDALAIAQRYVEQHVVVSDREAIEAERFLLERAKVLTELAASCTLAAARRLKARFAPEDHVALILCGGNVSLDQIVDYSRESAA